MFHVKHICYIAPSFICAYVLLFCCKFDGAKSIFWCLTWNKRFNRRIPEVRQINRVCSKISYRIATRLFLNRKCARAIQIANNALPHVADVSYETHNENLAQIIFLWQKKSRTTPAINKPIKKLGRRAKRWQSAQIDCKAADKIAEKSVFQPKNGRFRVGFFPENKNYSVSDRLRGFFEWHFCLVFAKNRLEMALRRPFLADFFHFFRRFKTHLKTRKIAKNTRFYRQFHEKYRWTQAKQPSCQKTACPAEEMPGAKGGPIVFTANGGKCANIKTVKRSEIVGCAEFFVRT